GGPAVPAGAAALPGVRGGGDGGGRGAGRLAACGGGAKAGQLVSGGCQPATQGVRLAATEGGTRRAEADEKRGKDSKPGGGAAQRRRRRGGGGGVERRTGASRLLQGPTRPQ